MLRPGLLRQDGVGVARMHDLHQHVQGATIHAEGDRECRGLSPVALHLSLFDAAAAPPDLMHQLEAARGLVDVHDAVCADSVLVHQPAQLKQPVRVGVLLFRAVELFHALGGLLVGQVRATQELSDPPGAGRTSCPSASSHSRITPLIVTALRHRASVTRRICSLSHVMSTGESKVFLPRGAAGGAPFPAVGSVRVDPVEHPGAQPLELVEAPLHALPPFRSPLVQHVEETECVLQFFLWLLFWHDDHQKNELYICHQLPSLSIENYWNCSNAAIWKRSPA